MRDFRSIELWKDVSEEQWNDWHWQIANRVTTIDELKRVINLTEEEADVISQSLATLRMAITPYYASLMDPDDPDHPVRKQAVPTIHETEIAAEDLLDPCHEDVDSPAPGLTHRYPDRGIVMVTDQCSMYCRHCTRRRKAGETDRPYTKEQIMECLDYLRETPTFRDLLFTGGDPLTLEDDMLEWIFSEAKKIPHLEMLRIGSRVPVVMPQRITPELCALLKKYHPMWLNTHFNHPLEITPASRKACEMLADAGVPLGNQSVLLKDVNDSPYVFRELNQKLLTTRVRPYYIYQCDLSTGISHFRTSVAKGLEIMEYLRGHTTGLAVPYFILDGPNGGGKIPLLPNYLLSMSDKKVLVRNYEGVITSYAEPRDKVSKEKEFFMKYLDKNRLYSREGLVHLFEGDQVSMAPAHLDRMQRSANRMLETQREEISIKSVTAGD